MSKIMAIYFNAYFFVSAVIICEIRGDNGTANHLYNSYIKQCSYNDDCIIDNRISNQVCINSTCKCKPTYLNINNTCRHVPCDSNNQCPDQYRECLLSKCECKYGYVQNDSTDDCVEEPAVYDRSYPNGLWLLIIIPFLLYFVCMCRRSNAKILQTSRLLRSGERQALRRTGIYAPSSPRIPPSTPPPSYAEATAQRY